MEDDWGGERERDSGFDDESAATLPCSRFSRMKEADLRHIDVLFETVFVTFSGKLFHGISYKRKVCPRPVVVLIGKIPAVSDQVCLSK